MYVARSLSSVEISESLEVLPSSFSPVWQTEATVSRGEANGIGPGSRRASLDALEAKALDTTMGNSVVSRAYLVAVQRAACISFSHDMVLKSQNCDGENCGAHDAKALHRAGYISTERETARCICAGAWMQAPLLVSSPGPR